MNTNITRRASRARARSRRARLPGRSSSSSPGRRRSRASRTCRRDTPRPASRSVQAPRRRSARARMCRRAPSARGTDRPEAVVARVRDRLVERLARDLVACRDELRELAGIDRRRIDAGADELVRDHVRRCDGLGSRVARRGPERIEPACHQRLCGRRAERRSRRRTMRRPGSSDSSARMRSTSAGSGRTGTRSGSGK